MDWVIAHKEIALALLSAVCVAIGYAYRIRMERRQNLREALHLLLEIWHRIGLLGLRYPEHAVDALTQRLAVRFPSATMPPEELAALKSQIVPIMQEQMRKHALDDLEELRSSYIKAVKLIARTHPIYAFKLEAAAHVHSRLKSLDAYLAAAYQPVEQQSGASREFAQALRDRLERYAERDELRGIENGLRGLALRLSPWSLLQVHLLIRKRHASLNLDVRRDIDEYIDSIIVPLLNEPSGRN